MVRSIVSIIVAALLIISGGIAEKLYLDKSFSDLKETFTKLQTEIENETCTEKQAKAAQEKWLEEKEKLHIFIPHSEIKEVDLWVSECVAYVRLGDYDEATDKVIVTLQLFEQIPKTFSLRTENLL